MKTGDFPPNPLEKSGYFLEFNDEFGGDSLRLDKWILGLIRFSQG
jgi:hypothetical protein